MGRLCLTNFDEIDRKLPFGECDLVGLVIRVNDSKGAPPIVFICDSESNIAIVQFSQSIEFLALDKIVTVKSFVRFKNLKQSKKKNSVCSSIVLRFEFSLQISDVTNLPNYLDGTVNGFTQENLNPIM